VTRARRFGDGNGPVGSHVDRGIITRTAGHCEVLIHFLDVPEKNQSLPTGFQNSLDDGLPSYISL